MADHEPYVRTQQVADALGISVSTVKRWVDRGEIAAARTVGRHRLIALSDALRFARARDLPTAGLEQMGDGDGSGAPEDPASRSVDGATLEALVESLHEGRTQPARRLIEGMYRGLGSGAALADEVIAPVLAKVGHGWSVGLWDVFEEHRASRIVSEAIAGLIAGIEERPGPVAIGAAPAGDFYSIPGLLAELTLRELGWNVTNFGPNLPLVSLARAVETLRPGLVYVTVSHLVDPIALIRDFQGLHEATRAVGAVLIGGGRALGPDVLRQLPLDGYGARMRQLAELGTRRRPNPPPPPTAPPPESSAGPGSG